MPYTRGEYGAILYDSTEALKAIEAPIEPDLDLTELRKQREKAEIRVSLAKAEKLEIEIDRMNEVLIPVQETEEILGKAIVAFRSKLLSLPSKCALQILGLSDAREIEWILKNVIHEALNELQEVSFEIANDGRVQTDNTSA